MHITFVCILSQCPQKEGFEGGPEEEPVAGLQTLLALMSSLPRLDIPHPENKSHFCGVLLCLVLM